MSKRSIYLDNNATTRPIPEVNDAVQSIMEVQWGNPSSIHRIGQEARQRVDLAREQVAKLIHVSPAEITFTSGGTEAANLALHTACQCRPDRNVVVTSQLEHAAVSEMVDAMVDQGIEVVRLENDSDGVISMQHLEAVLDSRASEIAVVSIMWCNNETGVVEPIETACTMCSEHDVLLHTDGTQWVAKMPVDVGNVPVDLLSFAAHKFHGPKGIGALYARHGLPVAPLVRGGPQERSRRGGTENVPAIVGFGVAAEVASTWLTKENTDAMFNIRDQFESHLLECLPHVVINSSGATRAWTTISVAFPNMKGELLLLMLSERGIYASSGSACSSGAFKESAVIAAIGNPDDGAWGTVRFSIARTTTPSELNEAVSVIVEATQKAMEVMSSTAI